MTLAQAQADLNRVATALGKEYPKEDLGVSFHLAQLGLLGDMLRGPVKGFLSGVMGLALLMLLAACANLGVLFRLAWPTVQESWASVLLSDRAERGFCSRSSGEVRWLHGYLQLRRVRFNARKARHGKRAEEVINPGPFEAAFLARLVS